jgi:hypothetical protein
MRRFCTCVCVGRASERGGAGACTFQRSTRGCCRNAHNLDVCWAPLPAGHTRAAATRLTVLTASVPEPHTHPHPHTRAHLQLVRCMVEVQDAVVGLVDEAEKLLCQLPQRTVVPAAHHVAITCVMLVVGDGDGDGGSSSCQRKQPHDLASTRWHQTGPSHCRMTPCPSAPCSRRRDSPLLPVWSGLRFSTRLLALRWPLPVGAVSSSAPCSQAQQQQVREISGSALEPGCTGAAVPLLRAQVGPEALRHRHSHPRHRPGPHNATNLAARTNRRSPCRCAVCRAPCPCSLRRGARKWWKGLNQHAVASPSCDSNPTLAPSLSDACCLRNSRGVPDFGAPRKCSVQHS